MCLVGGLVTAVVLLFIFMGALGGFVSARIYKMLNGTLWRRNTALTAVGFPALIAGKCELLALTRLEKCVQCFWFFSRGLDVDARFLGTAFFINLFVWAEHSTRAIPITTMVALVFLWVGISVPLVCLGT